MKLSGEQLAAVTDRVIGIWVRHHGCGPESGKTFINDRLLVTVLRGGMTPQERTLAERGQGDLVRQIRMAFEEAIRDESTRAIRDVTGHDVVDYQSQVLLGAELTVELFLLAED